MSRMLKSITLPWRTAKPPTAHALICPSRKPQPPRMSILVMVMLVLLALFEVANAKEEVVIKFNYEKLKDFRKDHAYKGDDVRFEVKSSDELVIAASSGYECEVELEAVEYQMTNHNGTYSWTKYCIEDNFYYYIKPRGGGTCKFGMVEVGDDNNINADNADLPRSHSKMKSPVPDIDNGDGDDIKCEDGFVKKDGECYESSYRMALIIVHSVVGGIIIGGLVVWFIVWRRRRRSKMNSEESALPKTPTTSDVPGDASSTVVASAPTDIVIGGLSGVESNHAMSELNGEPRLGQALNAPAIAGTLSTQPSAPDISELVLKTDTGDPPTYEEATMPMRDEH